MRTKCHIFFETLATKLKVDIILKLREKPLNVSELSRQLHQERSKVSHALSSLHDCGFVAAAKKGRERIYSLNKKTIAPLLKLVERHVKDYCRICRKAG